MKRLATALLLLALALVGAAAAHAAARPITIALVNRAQVRDAQLKRIARALNDEMRLLREHWPGRPVRVTTHPTRASWPLYFVEQIPGDAGGAADHSGPDLSHPTPYARVDVNSDGISLSEAASHESLEMVVDPDGKQVARTPRGRLVEREVCDPAAEDDLMLDHQLVADFVFPSWFRVGAPPPYDLKGAVDAPFDTFDGDMPPGATPTPAG